MGRVRFAIAVTTIGAALVGCNSSSPQTAPSDEHDHSHEAEHHGEHPSTYAAAVERLAELHTAAKSALAAEDFKKADGPVHEFGHVLEDVPSLAQKASLGEDEQAEIKQAVETLFDCFGKIDDKIHGGEGATYEEVESKIDGAMATLRKHVQVAQ